MGEPAPVVLGRVCTHQEAGGIIQEAAKTAHKAPLQEGGVFWGQLVRLVDDSRRAKTLPCCGREGLREPQARIHPSEGRASPALGTAAVCRAQREKLGESHNIRMKARPEPRGCGWWQGPGVPHTPWQPGWQPAFTCWGRLTLGSVGWVQGPVEVAPELWLVLGVDQLEDALVHDICLEGKCHPSARQPVPPGNSLAQPQLLLSYPVSWSLPKRAWKLCP